ncbi:MAG: PAS domain-containing protein [Microscillaceae bacterium]|nr:PAS domain-containing protein [Microscillaceae bacterium]
MLKVKNYQSIHPLPEDNETSPHKHSSEIEQLNQEIAQKNEMIYVREKQLEEMKEALQKTRDELTLKQKALEQSSENIDQLQAELDLSRQKLSNSIQQLSTIVESAPASIALFDNNLRYMSTSQRWLRDYKIDYDVIGMSHYDVFPELPQYWKDIHNQCLRGEVIRSEGEKFMHQDGTVQWIKWEIRPWFLGTDIQGLLMMTEDITEQKILQEKLGTSEKTYESLFNNIPDMISRMDKNFRYLDINDTFCKVFKVTRDEVVGKTPTELGIPAEVLGRDFPVWHQAFHTGRSFTYYNDISFDKKILSYQVKVVPEFNSPQEVSSLLVISSDITRLRKSENIIRSSQRKYKTLVNHLPHRVIRFDTSLRLIYDNQHIEIISAISGDHLLGTNLHAMNLREKELQIFEKHLLQVIKSHKQVEWSHRYHQPHGDRYILHIACPEFGDNTEVLESVLVIGIDITDLKIAEQNTQMLNEELSQLNEELSASNEELLVKQFELRKVIEELEQRNHELDNIVYKISHDIRAPLASILGLVNIIKDEDNTQNILKYVDLIEGRALKLDGFIRKMLDFAKANRGKNELELIDFEELIKETLLDLSYMKGFESVNTNVHIDLKGQKYWGDILKLRIIFSNIISNTIKYQNFFVDDSFLKISIELDYKLLTITFKDNGVGIAEEHLSKICEIFYRANEKADGSGLGLYIVKQTIDKLHGKLKIRSRLSEGTEIRVLLPVVDVEEDDES